MAFKVASHYLNDEDNAKEIAQVTAIECFLNHEKIRQDTLHSWIFTVAKNKSLNLIKFQGRQTIIDPNILDKIKLNSLQKEFNKTGFEDIEMLLERTPKSIISFKKRELLLQVINNNYKINKIASKLNINKNSLRIKIYRIHQEMLLYHRLLNGCKRLYPIPGTKLHHNIMNFIKKLKDRLDKNDFSIFKDYIINEQTKKILKSISIGTHVNYQLDIIEENTYLLFVGYLDKKKTFKGFRLLLSASKYKLCVRSLPESPKKIVKIEEKDLPESFVKTLKSGKDGMPIYTREELNNQIKEKAKKIDLIYSQKKGADHSAP